MNMNYRYCLFCGRLYRYEKPTDNGEFYRQEHNTWHESNPPSMKGLVERGSEVRFISLYEAVEMYPEAFQQ